jgi:hypothetical protein
VTEVALLPILGILMPNMGMFKRAK